MSKITYEIFGTEAEISDFSEDSGARAAFSFSERVDGFLSIDGIAVRITEGEGSLDLRLLEDGEYEPHLILKNKRISLPKVKKEGKALQLSPCESEYVRLVSLRERRLEKRVHELEEELARISKQIYGTALF